MRCFDDVLRTARSISVRCGRCAGALASMVVIALATGVFAGDVHDSATYPVEWAWMTEATPGDIEAKIDEGFRLIDLDVEGVEPISFTAVFVKNEGIYASESWWYWDLDLVGLYLVLAEHGARIIDIEMTQPSEAAGIAVVLVPNTNGAWWGIGSPLASVINTCQSAAFLPTDIEYETDLGNYSYAALPNPSDEPWMLEAKVTVPHLEAQLAKGQWRITDIEPQPDKMIAYILHGNPENKQTWWYTGLEPWEINVLADANGARVIDVERYEVDGETRYMAVLIENEIPPCPEDLDGDGLVDGEDLGLLLGNWGCDGECQGDVNYDGIVDGADLGQLLSTWDACSPA